MSERLLIDALLSGKPYFGPAMRALQGPAIRHQYFGPLVECVATSTSRRDIQILEIGSWAGASAVSWAYAIKKLGRPGRVTCVDLWRPYFDLAVNGETHYREMDQAAKGNIFQLFLHNIRASNVSKMIDYLVGSARDILPQLPSAKFDLVYIDGSHIYEDVRSDIQAAKRLLRRGGIVCGDDLELSKSDVDAKEHMAAVGLQRDYVYSHKAKGNYHPGVTEAVTVEFGEVSSWDGIWATRKTNSQWEKIELAGTMLQIPEHIRNAAQAETQEEQGPLVERVGETGKFNLVKMKEKFLAVAKETGPMNLFLERIGERELVPVLWLGENVEEVREKALAFERQNLQPDVVLVEEIGRYNIVKAGERYLAVAKELGPLNLFLERIGERELAPVLWLGESVEEVREKALAFERQNLQPDVVLVEEIGRYNIVKAGERYLAVAKELGPLNLFSERLGERELSPLVMISHDLSSLRDRIVNEPASRVEVASTSS